MSSLKDIAPGLGIKFNRSSNDFAMVSGMALRTHFSRRPILPQLPRRLRLQMPLRPPPTLPSNDEADNLQEIVNKHLQYKIDEHFATCHKLNTKRMKISSIKTSDEHAFLILALDKPLKIDLESDLLIGGKFFSCISAMKADKTKGIESRLSTVFEEMTKWSTFDENFKKQNAVSNDEFLVCVLLS